MGTSRGMPLGGPIEGYQERGRRLWQEQQAPRDREAQMQAMITSPGVNLPSLEEAYQLPQLRRDRQDARAEQLRAGLQEQQRLLAGASPGVVGLGLNEARAQQQQRQEQAQEEEGRRQFEFWSKAQSQDRRFRGDAETARAPAAISGPGVFSRGCGWRQSHAARDK